MIGSKLLEVRRFMGIFRLLRFSAPNPFAKSVLTFAPICAERPIFADNERTDKPRHDLPALSWRALLNRTAGID